MLVRGFLFNVFLDTSAPSSVRISCVKNVDDNVGRVDNLVTVREMDVMQIHCHIPCKVRSISSYFDLWKRLVQQHL